MWFSKYWNWGKSRFLAFLWISGRYCGDFLCEIPPMVNLVGSDISLGKRLGFFLRLQAPCRLTPYLNSNSSKLQIEGFYKVEGVCLEFCTDSLQWSSKVMKLKSLNS